MIHVDLSKMNEIESFHYSPRWRVVTAGALYGLWGSLSPVSQLKREIINFASFPKSEEIAKELNS